MGLLRPKSKHEFNSALIGMVLGEANMQKLKANTALYLRHGGKQFDYVNEKVKYLNDYIKPKSLNSKTDNKDFDYRYVYYNSEKLNFLYKSVYIKGVKTITDSILNRFNYVSLAFFYMDNGRLTLRKNKDNEGNWTGSYKSREIILCVHRFSFEEVEKFRKMLKRKFDLDFHLTTYKGKPKLWCNTKNTIKLIEIVKPIVSSFETMSYKIDLKYLKK